MQLQSGLQGASWVTGRTLAYRRGQGKAKMERPRDDRQLEHSGMMRMRSRGVCHDRIKKERQKGDCAAGGTILAVAGSRRRANENRQTRLQKDAGAGIRFSFAGLRERDWTAHLSRRETA